MSITAKRGDYRIVDEVAHCPVAGRVRLKTVTFSPQASRSRRGITDSGERYEIQVVQDLVRIRRPGADWTTLEPSDPQQPWGRSFQNRRNGEGLQRVQFDMIAAGRGRLFAKEAGTDRFFSLIIDPLFRTSRTTLSDGTVVNIAPDGGDPIVPSTYLKLDPEYFTDGNFAQIPAGLRATYAHHPASERFRVFALQLGAQLTDMWCVLPRAGVWHLVDTRSPLKIVDLDDFNCLGDADVKAALTKARIKNVLVELGRAQFRDADFVQMGNDLVAWLRGQVTPQVPDFIAGPVDALRDAVTTVDGVIGDIVGLASGLPVIGGAVRALSGASVAVEQVASDLIGDVQAGLRGVLNGLAAPIVDAVLDLVAGIIATRIREDVAQNGMAALFGPAWLAGGLAVRELSERGIVAPLEPDPVAIGRIPIQPPDRGVVLDLDAGRLLAVDLRRFRCRGARTGLGVHLGKLKAFMTDQQTNALGRMIDAVIEASRARRQATIPNAPPDELPTYVHLAYERPSAPGLPPVRHERTAIRFSRVMDLGVGTVHWSEQWHMGFGGEMHAIFARRPMFQQEQFGLALYRALNGPVIDGDGWQDGTTNFYILVALEGAGRVPSRRKFAVLFLDEQSYFTQRWRLVHPLKDIAGDVFSLSRQLYESPEYFAFNAGAYWDPFEEGHITAESRMGVARQIIAVTGFDPDTNDAEIYTFCFSWGLSDRTWRWRRFPLPNVGSVPDEVLALDGDLPASQGQEKVFQNTLGIREDATLHVRGWNRVDAAPDPVAGRWFQRYLPCDCQHATLAHELTHGKPARGFDHPWTFATEPVFQQMDAYYQFGVYEPIVDARCQYYAVEMVPAANGDLPDDATLADRIWSNGGQNPLRIETLHLNWELPENDAGQVPVESMLRDHGRRASMSMYEEAAKFRLLKRGALGWIAVFADKRDDDLQPASHLPRVTRLRSDGSDWRNLDVVVRANRRVLRPPVVLLARVRRVRVGPRTQSVIIEFWSPLGVEEAYESLWRVCIGTPSGPRLFRSEVHGVFVREALPDAPLPLTPTRGQVQTPAYRYSYEWTGFDDIAAIQIDAAIRPDARATVGTSIWFENVVGHFAIPDFVRFE